MSKFEALPANGVFLGSLFALLAFEPAFAQVNIGSGSTTIRTSTAADGQPSDLTITTDAIRTAASAPALIVDSAHSATNSGTINRETTDEGALVIITAGAGRTFRSTGKLNITDGYTRTDTDNDGDLDGVLSTAQNRVGILIGENATLTSGDFYVERGAILVEGNTSSAVRLAGPFSGQFSMGRGNGGDLTLSVVGDQSKAIDLAGLITGDVNLRVAAAGNGVGAQALSIGGGITGKLELAGTYSSSAYTFIERGTKAQRDKLDSDDLGQAGSALSITASIGGGLLLSGIGVEADTDDDRDGILDNAATDPDLDDNRTSAVTTYGSAPALIISGRDRPVTLGRTSFGAGFVNRGAITAAGVYDGVSATGMLVENNVTILGGLLNQGSILAAVFTSQATSLSIQGGTVGGVVNDGSITSVVVDGNANDATSLLLGASADIRTFSNNGTVSATIVGGNGRAIGVKDLSGSLNTIFNSGTWISALSESDTDSGNVSGTRIALDVSANTSGVSFRQLGKAIVTDDDSIDNTADTEVRLIGDILFGSGNDTLSLEAGTIASNVNFGAGTDRFDITGGAFTGQLIDSDGSLALNIRGGNFRLTKSTPTRVGSLSLNKDARWTLNVDLKTDVSGALDVAGTATIAQDAIIVPILTGSRKTEGRFTLLRAGELSWQGTGAIVNLTAAPFLYKTKIERTSTSLDLVVTPRTAVELGLTTSEGNALSALLDLANASSGVSLVLNSQSDPSKWRDAYRRLLPDYTDGKIATALAATRGTSDAVRNLIYDIDNGGKEPGATIWAQQFGFTETSDSAVDQSRDGGGFGLTAGIGDWLGPFDLLALTGSFTSGKYDRGASDSLDAEVFSLSSLSAGFIAVVREGGWRADFSSSVGYDWIKSTRRVAIKGITNDLASGIDETARGDGNGWRATLSGELGYRAQLTESITITPFGRVDGVRLMEKGYKETGAEGLNVEYGEHTSTRVNARLGLEASYNFGAPDDGWSVSLMGGTTNVVLDESDKRRARYIAAGEWFDLEPPTRQDDGVFVGLGASFRNSFGAGALRIDGEEQGDRQNLTASVSLSIAY